MKLVESRLPFEYITVMIQKEVAVRLAAPAGDPEYGAITAALAYYGSVERLFTVPAGCFLPAPKVDSAVIRIRLHKEPPVSVKNEDMLFRVIRGGFAQRRKTLSPCVIYPDTPENRVFNFRDTFSCSKIRLILIPTSQFDFCKFARFNLQKRQTPIY